MILICLAVTCVVSSSFSSSVVRGDALVLVVGVIGGLLV